MGEALIVKRASLLQAKRYGVRVADDESDPIMERIYDSAEMIANVGTTLLDTPRNDFDNIYPFNKIIEETINGRVMMRIPKFYVRREHYQEFDTWYREWAICERKYDESYVPHEMFLKGNVQYTGNNPDSDYNNYTWVSKYEISSNNQSISDASVQVSQTRATMRTNAKAIGNGWSIMDIATWNGLWILFHIVFANRDSGSIMAGNRTSTVLNTGLTTGALASCVQIAGSVLNSGSLSFYGIENLYSNTTKVVDGLNVYGGNQFYSCTNIANYIDDGSTNYVQIAYSTNQSSGYVKAVGFDANNKYVEVCTEVGASATTFFCSTLFNSIGVSWRVVGVGADNTSFYSTISGLYIYFTSTSTWSSGSSLLIYRPY